MIQKLIYILVFITLGISSCTISAYSAQKRGFEAFKQHPIENANIVPRTNGYYTNYSKDGNTYLILNEDGASFLSVEISDFKGTLILSETFTSLGSEFSETLEIPHSIESGIYLITVRTNDFQDV